MNIDKGYETYMKLLFEILYEPCSCWLIVLLGNNPRKARDVIINFVIFNKETLNLFNPNRYQFGFRLLFFLVFSLLKHSYNSKSIFILVCSIQIVDVFGFPGDNQKNIIICLISFYMNFR